MKSLAAPVLAALLALCTASAQAADEPEAAPEAPGYELGQGLPLGNSGFTAGGYATARYESLKDSTPRFSASHLSLFLWREGNDRLKFFSELDLENALASSYSGPDENRRYLALERFYFDYAFSDTLTLRLGKFLTPIGRWNQIHADPLIWTTSRPLVTSEVFPGNATGAMLLGTLPVFGRDLDYSVYSSTGPEWRSTPAQDPFNEARGVHLGMPVGSDLQLGFSYSSFEQVAERDERKNLVGCDFVWSHKGFEISGEAVSRSSSEGPERNARGGFVQAAVPLAGRLFGVGRVEAYRHAGSTETLRMWVGGINYRITPAASFKAELVRAINNDIGAPQGFLSSLSVLF